jgi:hypothetical protein
VLYAIYMFGVDVPMYWQRWLGDEARGREYLSLLQGAIDVSSRWTVTHRWDDWSSEVVWMSLYFSVAVWLSISLVRITPAADVGSARTAVTRLSQRAAIVKG